MASNLLDTIRQNTLTQVSPGVGDDTQNLSRLLRAKSGKSVSGGDIAASNLGEQQAVSQTQGTLSGQIAPAAAAQTAAIDTQAQGQQQQLDTQKANVAQSNRFNTIQKQLQTSQILSDFERSKGQLDLDKNRAAANQVTQNLRLSNSQYIDQLQREGARARLDNDIEFRKQLAETTFGNNIDLLQQRLGNKSILSANSREFSKLLSNIDAETASSLFASEMAGAKTNALYGGVGALSTAGVGAYGTYKSNQNKSAYSDYAKSGGTDSYSTWEAKQETEEDT